MSFLWHLDIRHVIRFCDISQLFSGEVHLSPPPSSDKGRDRVHLVQPESLFWFVCETAEHGFINWDPLYTGGICLGFVRGPSVVHFAG